jgi:hypothetical protein
MGLAFWRKPISSDFPFSDKILRRVSKVPTADLTTWVDQALTETYKAVSKYQKNEDEVYLEEMLMGAEAIHCLVVELRKRNRP